MTREQWPDPPAIAYYRCTICGGDIQRTAKPRACRDCWKDEARTRMAWGDDMAAIADEIRGWVA